MSAIRFDRFQQHGFNFISMENEELKLSFLPDIGGKMIELYHKPSSREFLVESRFGKRQYNRPFLGAAFEKYDISGFDECFPTIAPSRYSVASDTGERWLSLPDHGELWNRPWNYEIHSEYFYLNISGVYFPYTFTKKIFLKGRKVRIEYQVSNRSKMTFHFLWSAHPLLKVEPGDKLIFQNPVSQAYLEWSSEPHSVRYGKKYPWPGLGHASEATDWSLIQSAQKGFAAKCFIESAQSGSAGVYFFRSNESLLFHYRAEEIPYLGVWLCYGGWPSSELHKHLTVALEPCSSPTDVLQQAVEQGQGTLLPPGGSLRWELELEVVPGNPFQS